VHDDTVGDKDAARMLVDLARALRQFLWFGGRWDEHVQLSARAYQAARVLQDWSKAGWRAFDVAWVHHYRARNDDEAALWVDRCAEAWGRGGSKGEQAEATRMRELVARQRKDYDEAERLLQEALAVRRDLGLAKEVANVLNDLGRLARECKDHDAAEQYSREAWDLARKIDDKDLQAACMSNLGLLAFGREQWAEARQWFEQALALARQVGRIGMIAQAQHGLARACGKRKGGQTWRCRWPKRRWRFTSVCKTRIWRRRGSWWRGCGGNNLHPSL
jgi:tetratricopeptide (TPR) repeat protein